MKSGETRKEFSVKEFKDFSYFVTKSKIWTLSEEKLQKFDQTLLIIQNALLKHLSHTSPNIFFSDDDILYWQIAFLHKS